MICNLERNIIDESFKDFQFSGKLFFLKTSDKNVTNLSGGNILIQIFATSDSADDYSWHDLNITGHFLSEIQYDI